MQTAVKHHSNIEVWKLIINYEKQQREKCAQNENESKNIHENQKEKRSRISDYRKIKRKIYECNNVKLFV